MNEIRQYLLSLIAASVICSIAKRIIGNDSSFTPLVCIICGLFIAVTILSPWIKLNIYDFVLTDEGFYEEARTVSDSGKAAADVARQAIIKEQTESYILNKASSLGAEISVEVTLDENNVPYKTVIYGTISPYGKTVLGQYMEDTLSIPKERQLWM